MAPFYEREIVKETWRGVDASGVRCVRLHKLQAVMFMHFASYPDMLVTRSPPAKF